MKRVFQNIPNKKGFTLIEMIVALGVFAIAALISTSSLLALTNAQKKALVFESTQDNMRFALETMGRDIRTGDSYHCADDVVLTPLDCPFGNDVVTFRNVAGATVTYQVSENRIKRSVNGGPFERITSSDITIANLIFYVLGSSTSDTLHPRVTIAVRGVSGSGTSLSELDLETTVSQRKVQR